MKNNFIIVTSPTSAIGMRICFLLAARGFDLILISWRQDLAEALMMKILNKYSIRILIIREDLQESCASKNILSKISSCRLMPELIIEIALIEENTAPWKNDASVSLPLVASKILHTIKKLEESLKIKYSSKYISLHPIPQQTVSLYNKIPLFRTLRDIDNYLINLINSSLSDLSEFEQSYLANTIGRKINSQSDFTFKYLEYFPILVARIILKIRMEIPKWP